MLAENIKQLRIKRKLSQESLARLAGISYNTIIKIESGASGNPTIKSLAGIAKALNVSVDELIENKKKK